MNSAFQRHGIERLSASSINAWIDSPGIWALRYLAGMREDTNAAMARGTAVEAGMLQLAHGKPMKDALIAADSTFAENLGGEINDDIEAEQKLMPSMLAIIHEWGFAEKRKILGSQVKIEHWLDGVSVPLIGYVDFTFENAPLLDLKTTKRIPSEPRPDHARQVSLYMVARKEPGALLYVSDKRHSYYEIDNATRDQSIAQLHSAALSLERFLSRFESGEDAIRCLPMNPDSFKFSKAAAAKLMELHL